MGLEPDDVKVFADQWGLRRMFSLAIRRRGAPRKVKDLMVEAFFQELIRYWGIPPKQTGRGKKGSVEPASEDEVDQDELSDPEQLPVTLLRVDTDGYERVLSQDDNPAANPVENESEAPHGASHPAETASEIPGSTADNMNQHEDDDELDLEEQLLLEKIQLLE